MTKRRFVTAAVLAIAAVLVLCSCGGGGGKRLTKKEFAAKADAFCAAFNKKVNAAGTPKNVAEAAAMFEKLLPLDRQLVANVKKLKPPADEEATVKQVIALGEEQANRAEALIAALKKNDLTKANTLIAEGNTNSKKSRSLFKELGAKECAK